ncbi:hypothetical protein OAN46_00070 [Candidatus Pelagibacter sp.]|nr:hypothetical protein [Candidatus Pelagibacter sp.]
MNISYISNSSCPSSLPSSLQIVKTCEFLSKHKNQVNLIIPNTGDAKLSLNKFYDIKFKFNVIRINKFQKFPLGINYYLFSLISFLKAKKISDLIITRNFFVTFLCSIFKKKCVIELHGDLSNESRINRFIFSIFKVLNFKSIHKVICISKSIKTKFIKEKYVKDTKKVLVLPSGSSLKMKYKISLNIKRLKLGYFGTINPSRGIKVILKLAQNDKKNDYYIFGGSKNQIMDLKKKYILKNLYIEPHQNIKKVKYKMKEMDILLMPYSNKVTVSGNVSDTTNYMSPLKLFDYMSTGRLILSSNLNVLKEVVNENQCIFINNYLNPFSWLLEIKKIEKNILKRNIIGKNSYINSKKFSHNSRVLKYL